jgi:hypothetical protein
LCFIVIQKPNSNKVFLSYLILSYLIVTLHCNLIWLSHVEQELLNLSDHLSSPPGFSSVLYMIACPVFLVLLYCLSVVNLRLMITSGFFNWLSFSIMCSVLLHPFSSGYCVVYPSTTHGFLLSLWCVQTFLIVLKLWWFSNNRLVTLLDCSVMLQ